MTWYVDPAHSSVNFAVKHMMVSTVRGSFGGLRGTLDFDPAAPEMTALTVSLDAGTVDTGEAKRDGHLKSADFFDAATYPTITFESTRTAKVDGRRFRLDGVLTIRDVAKPVSFDVELEGIGVDGQGGRHLGGVATVSIDRREFGLVWNQPIQNGVMVGEKVKIEVDLAAIDESTAKRYGMAA